MNIGKLTREEIFSLADELKLDEDFKQSSARVLDNAARDFDFEYVRLLLDIGVAPSKEIIGDLAYVYGQEKDRHGEMAIKMAELLLDSGAEPNALSAEYRRPLDICDTFNAVKFKELLIKHGASDVQSV